MLQDSFGRVATDLRVSVTDRCNLRCTYCMPPEGLDWIPGDELLSAAELVRIVRLAVDQGVQEVRFTGGEPLVRPDLEEIIAGVASLPDPPSLSLTTNGIGLTTRAQTLKDAGLARINVSLDTLDAGRFRTLTRRDRLDDVLAGIVAARDAGLSPVKINTVLMRAINDDEVLSLVEWALDHGLALRFIEQMPLDAQRAWSRADMVEAGDILAQLEAAYVLTPSGTPRGSEPAETWNVLGADGAVRGSVGVIGSVTRPFCASCDRVRLTSDGQLRNCLFAQTETDLRGPLRSGATDDQVVALMQECLAAKRAGHGIDDPTFLPPPRPMSAIGG
ncbi:MAG: GTP 3',8-cyclase MoaA [Actinomycetes bacterium]|jgi:cyclic pyranopterin phosphate synthase